MKKPYFPPLTGAVDCGQCEKCASCWCAGKYQRNRRDFSHTSGRCPRLPDLRGFVEKEEREAYAATFPLVHAERGTDDTVDLTLMLPGEKHGKKVYFKKSSGFFYYNEKTEWGRGRRVVNIEWAHKPEDLLDDMNAARADYCIFRAKVENYYL